MRSLILGWGQTGISIAKFLEEFNISEYKIWDDFHSDFDIEKKEDDLSNVTKDNYNKIYTSPGIQPSHPLILHSQKESKGVPIDTDIDLFFDTYKELKFKIIGITGTNGKSTCAELLKEVLVKAGFVVEICGNVGYPILNLKNIDDYDYIILELSSFQLHYVNRLRLDMAAILNITEDHIDWHGSKEHYKNSKLSISEYVLGKNKTILGGITSDVLNNLSMDRYDLVNKAKFEKNFISKDIQNVIHGICGLLGIEDRIIEEVFNQNRTNPHRFEIFSVVNKLTFINDSKATNFSAVTLALEKIEKGLLVLHGNLKGVSTEYLNIPAGIHTVVFYGDNNLDYNLESKEVFCINHFDELPEIIDFRCDEGDSVILSPGGSSFEHFEDYKDRGNQFKKTINKAYLKGNPA